MVKYSIQNLWVWLDFSFGGGTEEGQAGDRLVSALPLSLCAHNAAPVERFPLSAAAAMLDALSMCPET